MFGQFLALYIMDQCTDLGTRPEPFTLPLCERLFCTLEMVERMLLLQLESEMDG